MDPRWQPHLGPVRPATATPEACALMAAGCHAHVDECRIERAQGTNPGLVCPETWRALRDRDGFIPVRVQMQHRGR
ncbi:hypothetical protein WG902_03145 [Ramlibacter sp. PS3R-8]|uniref:hypothetical protein n=1 Tax=Ramlibacter sp. PS3R-8 TaxID=3133437 RepID=UPI0030B2D2A8